MFPLKKTEISIDGQSIPGYHCVLRDSDGSRISFKLFSEIERLPEYYDYYSRWHHKTTISKYKRDIVFEDRMLFGCFPLDVYLEENTLIVEMNIDYIEEV